MGKRYGTEELHCVCNCEAIKVWTDALCQTLPGRDLMLKIEYIFFDNSCE